ncbi:MAG: alpha/beta hydrolase, partial [Chloroflexota bacterium]
MRTITSKDGTSIAFEQTGKGSALILVVGAFNDRTTGIPLAETLKQSFTVYNYDRRG